MNNLTDITLLIDRSGSMHSIKEAMEEAINGVIKDQQKDEDKVNITIYEFDSACNKIRLNTLVDTVSIHEITDYVRINPEGMTPLYDAVCMCMKQTGDRFNGVAEEKMPNRILFYIITDGHENASVEFTAADVKEKIQHQETKYSWQVLYLGANQDAIGVADTIGINKNFACNFNANTESIGGMCSNINRTMRSLKTSSAAEYCNAKSMGYTEEERQEMTK